MVEGVYSGVSLSGGVSMAVRGGRGAGVPRTCVAVAVAVAVTVARRRGGGAAIRARR
jgi:hypothetical protein